MTQAHKDAAQLAAGVGLIAGALVFTQPKPRTYPDPALTPGVVDPTSTKEKVCTPGYTKTIRNVNEQEKRAVFAEYNQPYVRGKYEVDHFISLELGGSNDIKNLWPESYEPRPGAHEKDEVENYLHKQVCEGKITLAQAQDLIRTDWLKVYTDVYSVKGSTNPEAVDEDLK